MIKCKLIYYDTSRDISEYKIKSSVNNIEDAKKGIHAGYFDEQRTMEYYG